MNMASKKRELESPECEGCLWNQMPPERTLARVASVTCLHGFCLQCVRSFAQTSNKRDNQKAFWFRCPVSTCGIMIQSNQLKDLTSKNLSQPMQYLLTSCNVTKFVSSAQKTIQFHLDNSKGHVKLQVHELERKLRLINKLETKNEELESKCRDLENSLTRLQRQGYSNRGYPSEPTFFAEQPNWHNPNLTFLHGDADETREGSLLF